MSSFGPTGPQPSPRVTRLDDGPFDVGAVARIKQPGLPECDWRVTERTGDTGFTWETRVYAISMSATHKLTPTDSGTQSILRIQLRGPLVLLLCPLIHAAVKKSLNRENAALKHHCESR